MGELRRSPWGSSQPDSPITSGDLQVFFHRLTWLRRRGQSGQIELDSTQLSGGD